MGRQATSSSWSREDLRAVRMHCASEGSSHWMYTRLAALDREEVRASLLARVAALEKRQAERWGDLAEAVGGRRPRMRPFGEHRAIVLLARLFGVAAVLPILHKGQVDDIATLQHQAATWTDPRARQVLDEVLPQEVSQEIDLFEQIRGEGVSVAVLRSGILGANDGLGSILALVAGVASATGSSVAVLVAGTAGLVAGAVSMAASNFVGVRAERDVGRIRAQLVRQAVAVAPEQKRRRLRASLEKGGMSPEDANHVARRLGRTRESLSKALLGEFHALPQTRRRPAWQHALTTLVAFLIAGAVPIVPFLFLDAGPGVWASLAASVAALFVAGTLRALASLGPVLRTGLEMVGVGLAAAAATYGVGLLLRGLGA